MPKDPTSVEPLRRERQELFHSNAGALDMPSKGSPGSNFLETEVATPKNILTFTLKHAHERALIS